MSEKHWSRMEYLHQTVTNPNIVIKGTHSYYSDCWDQGFERSVVRYLLGDEISRDWEPLGHLDKLIIGNFVCIGAESVILMGEIVRTGLTGSVFIPLWRRSKMPTSFGVTRCCMMVAG